MRLSLQTMCLGSRPSAKIIIMMMMMMVIIIIIVGIQSKFKECQKVHFKKWYVSHVFKIKVNINFQDKQNMPILDHFK